MLRVLDLDGNASSIHAEGRRLRGEIEAARDAVAALVGARPSDVVFTSGATEANVSVLSRGWDQVFAAGIEHDSVLAPIQASAAKHLPLAVTASGVVDAASFAQMVLTRPGALDRTLVTLQLVNNETGAIQPVADVAAFAREHGIACHTDAVQAAGRIAIDMTALGVDTLALSAHKIGGPKGIGALVVRDGSAFAPLLTGGGQERRRRAGTESVAAIAGFGAAATVALRELAEFQRIAHLRDRLENGVLQVTPQAVVFGYAAERVANTSCIGVPGAASDITVIKLDVDGFAVSAGSACSSGKVGASHVLAAMGADRNAARGAIRVSLGPKSMEADVDAFLAAWRRLHASRAHAVPSAPAATNSSGRAGFAAALTGD
jgi:cysteine desulfurase